MKRTLHFFNPEHDLALANADKNFYPPASALQLANDLDCLPLWIADAGDYILSSHVCEQWLVELRQYFPALQQITVCSTPDVGLVERILPWGWDPHCLNILKSKGLKSDILPDDSTLIRIKHLSHRRISMQAIRALDDLKNPTILFAPPAQEFTNMQELECFAKQNTPLVFKAPWSGSGKGLSWLRGQMTDSHRGWCKKIIEKQGSVIAEPVYNKIQDFAMLYRCENGQCQFIGYSLFETERGIYRSNALMTNEKIVEHLSQWLSKDLLRMIEHKMKSFIQSEIAAEYSGFLGVDMFIFEQYGRVGLHVCVEINLRLTMGCVARLFYDKYVEPGKTGHFFIDHSTRSGELMDDHLHRTKQLPIQLKSEKLESGYLSLTPVKSITNYRVRVEIAE